MTLGSCRSDSWFAHSVSVKDQPRTFPKELLQGWAVQRGLDSPGKESSRSQNPLVCHCPGEECGTDCFTPKLDVTGVWKHPDKAEMKDFDTKIFLKRQNKTQQKKSSPPNWHQKETQHQKLKAETALWWESAKPVPVQQKLNKKRKWFKREWSVSFHSWRTLLLTGLN